MAGGERSRRIAQKPVDVVRMRGGVRAPARDCAAVEEPFEIRLHGRPFAVVMRTPGADHELAAGFLLAEGAIRSADDLAAIKHCADAPNVVDVTLTDPGRLDDLFAERRHVTTNSSCGLCGRQTIESLACDRAPLSSTWTIAAAVVTMLPDRLRAVQSVFDETGGLHAAGLFALDGTLIDAAEDVGRHNAVDKVIGRMLIAERLPLSGGVLFVSGRASYEIVQKALYAGVPLVASVSAPSSLAVALADEMGVTLVGFVRGDSFNIYAHAQRIRQDA